MSNTAEKPFTIKMITEQDTEKVLEYLRQYFYGDEPLNECLNHESNEHLVPNNNRGLDSTSSIKEGLSIMAVTPSNEIIGLSMNKNFKPDIEKQRSFDENSSNFVKTMKLLKKVEEQIADLVKLQNAKEKEMSIRIISVHPEWRIKGVAYALLDCTREIAKQNGFNQVRSICTSAYSAKILEKIGFQCVHAIKYEDYKENGKVIFKPKPPHTHVKAMIFRI